jgi:hypothetical protein
MSTAWGLPIQLAAPESLVMRAGSEGLREGGTRRGILKGERE